MRSFPKKGYRSTLEHHFDDEHNRLLFVDQAGAKMYCTRPIAFYKEIRDGRRFFKTMDDLTVRQFLDVISLIGLGEHASKLTEVITAPTTERVKSNAAVFARDTALYDYLESVLPKDGPLQPLFVAQVLAEHGFRTSDDMDILREDLAVIDTFNQFTTMAKMRLKKLLRESH